jgi:hypothetical protein
MRITGRARRPQQVSTNSAARAPVDPIVMRRFGTGQISIATLTQVLLPDKKHEDNLADEVHHG